MGPHETGGADERPRVSRLINRLRPAPLESLGSLLERLRVANHWKRQDSEHNLSDRIILREK